MSILTSTELVSQLHKITSNIKSIELIFVTRHRKKGEYSYVAHYPVLGKELNNEVMNLIVNPLSDSIVQLSFEPYDPVVKNSDSIEYIDIEAVNEASKIVNEINSLHSTEAFSIHSIDNGCLIGYCIKIISNDYESIHLFKKNTNTKMLEKKKILWLTTGSTIEKMTSQPLIIDERVDYMLHKGTFYIFNSYLLEVFFYLNEEYRKKINSILKEIEKEKIIVNMESLKIAASEYAALKIITADSEKMNNLIEEHNLLLEVSSDNKIIYNEGDSVEPILRLIDGGLITMDVYDTKAHALKLSKPLE